MPELPPLWRRIQSWLRDSFARSTPRPHPILLQELYAPSLRLMYRDIGLWEQRVAHWLKQMPTSTSSLASMGCDATSVHGTGEVAQRLVALIRVRLLQLQRIHLLSQPGRQMWRGSDPLPSRMQVEQATRQLRQLLDWLDRDVSFQRFVRKGTLATLHDRLILEGAQLAKHVDAWSVVLPRSQATLTTYTQGWS